MKIPIDKQNIRSWGRLLVVGAVALITGLILGPYLGSEDRHPSIDSPLVEGEAPADQVWTCSMHPQIRLPGPGQCPICAMDLIPVSTGGTESEGRPRALRLSEAARQLASIQVAPAQRRFVPVEVRLVGHIDFDETRRKHITAWIPGRLDRLYVDYTGVPVRQGDHMVSLYSPALLTAQEELIQALRAVEGLEESSPAAIGETARLTLASTREKLRLWGLKPGQITAIEQAHTPSDHLTIFAPSSGIVVEKHVSEGEYVQTGTRIYTLADLSQVWLKLEAYESDLPWVRYGQEVEFETEAYPGEPFTGRVSFISPVLDGQTRTVSVRVNVANLEGRLKPGMFVRAVVRARVAAAGRVMDPALAGKWISPMHPEIVKDGPGSCDICGMPLVPTESLGFVSAAAVAPEAPLVVPASAVLQTGKRAIVYVAVAGEEGMFEGREIVLGPRAGDYYLVREGLQEGEQVVVNGSFKIDSALQIQARPSMMNPEGGGPAPGHAHTGHRPEPVEQADPHAGHAHAEIEKSGVLATMPAFQDQIGELFAAYFPIHQALSQDDVARAKQAVTGFARALSAVDMQLLEGPAHQVWMQQSRGLQEGAAQLRQAGDMEAARAAFAPLSGSMILVARRFGPGRQGPVYRFQCPMAFNNRGASWLQEAEETENPYFGSVMYRCGSREEAFLPAPGRKE